MEDICKNKHRGNEQSITANEKVLKKKDRNFILEYLEKNGEGYSKNLARAMNKQLNQISGRLSELKADGLIEATGLISEGCMNYTLAKKQMSLSL